MAEYTPSHLPPSSDQNPSRISTIETTPPLSIDEFIEQAVGNFSWTHLFQVLLVSSILIFDGQQAFITIFTDAIPPWRCTDLDLCTPLSSLCHLPPSSWSWNGPHDMTVISSFNLHCSSPFLTGLPSSSFFSGCLLGGFIIASFSDSFSCRKTILLASSSAMSVAALLTITSPNIFVYSFFKFLTGMGRSSVVTTAIVLLTERVGRRWRGRVAVAGFLFFSVGFISLPPIAYLNRNSSWKNLYLYTSLPGLIHYTIVYFLACESPRWLLLHGRDADAMETLKKLGSVNASYQEEVCRRKPWNYRKEKSCSSWWTGKEMVSRRWALVRVITVGVMGFGIGVEYFGTSMGVGNLGLNIYMSVAVNAVSEIPSYGLTFVYIERWKRRVALVVFCVVSGVSSVGCGVVDGRKGVQMGMEVVSFFCVSVAYSVVIVYTVELFPTCVRSLATSVVRQSFVGGAVISPVLISVGRRKGKEMLSYGVFGVLLLLSVVSLAWLPETRGVPLCDTMEEQERRDDVLTQAEAVVDEDLHGRGAV